MRRHPSIVCISVALLVAFVSRSVVVSAIDLSYYTYENCKNAGLLPQWNSANYQPGTHFERHFKTPLNLDLIASAHSANVSGFEQVTADWGCPFAPCYGEGCQSIGFYGPGAKDPKGGGCGHGPIKAYEELACAIKLGLASDRNAFTKFCEGDSQGMFECLAFFANVITETGGFAETEERDPRAYCWNRAPGNTDCCPAADHKPCLPDSPNELTAKDYPLPNDRWLTDKPTENKCCSYHGRGFLQVSYEPNYRALSKAMLDDEKVFWHYPYKLDSDGVAGWTAALWFWFNKHPAQVVNVKPEDIKTVPEAEQALWHTSPRDRVLDWEHGGGLPGAINVINGGECNGAMDSRKALNRVSYFFALAHRMKAVPPPGNQAPFYPLPGTLECDTLPFCKMQFHNDNSECKLFRNNIDCTDVPYHVNASTPIGFWRRTLKMTKADGATPVCKAAKNRGPSVRAWFTEMQSSLSPIPEWWKMLDVTTENVCDHLVHYFHTADGAVREGIAEVCRAVGEQKPCATLAMYMGHPLPRDGWESGKMGDYRGGAYLGRVGPGLVMALNGKWGFGDNKDKLCFLYGGSQCHWNVAQGCNAGAIRDVHNCRILPPGVGMDAITWTDVEPAANLEKLVPGQFPKQLQEVLRHWDRTNCPKPTSKTVLEQIFPKKELDIDLLFSMQYAQNDGFDNTYFDVENQTGVNHNLAGKGRWGPRIVWNEMLCAFNLGLPSDKDYIARKFGLRSDVYSADSVPFPLSEDERRFAMMEFIAFAANIIKETGALGQAEEQDPRCYCNYQGGGDNPCCPNEWGNNPPCYVSTEIGSAIKDDEMRRGTGQNAKCCSYHGRGFLQSSYEKNYGDMGEKMLFSPKTGVDKALARKFAINFPQYIDSMGIMGWSAAFMFWLDEHPCQYCNGRNTTTLDWNAKKESAHTSIVKFDVPGEGLGKTFNIINGQECEAAFTSEATLSQLGSAMRLSFFYNAAYRFQAKAPSDDFIFPLPGTAECAKSKWCNGTYAESGHSAYKNSKYRLHAGGCWALTPQPTDDGKEMWTFCRPQVVKGATRFGARLEVASFTMRRPSMERCEMLHDFSCGIKAIDPNNRPSMFTDESLKSYVSGHQPTSDYDIAGFHTYLGWSYAEFCPYTEDAVPNNNNPAAPKDCFFWCSTSSGANGNCAMRDDKTCEINGMGVLFLQCANKMFKGYLKDLASDCHIPTGNDGLLLKSEPPIREKVEPANNCLKCRECVSTSGVTQADSDCSNLCLLGRNSNQWPCHIKDYCKCKEGAAVVEEAQFDGNACFGCDSCVSESDKSWETANCQKCTAVPKERKEWPCSTPHYCKCVGAPKPAEVVELPAAPPKVQIVRTPPVAPTV